MTSLRLTLLGSIKLSLACLLYAATAHAATNYVWQESPNPNPPYTDWAIAAHTIQDAVDAAQAGDTVLATNGTYASGVAFDGGMVNRLVINQAIMVQSIMGPEVTVIMGAAAPGGTNGDGAIRCAYVRNGAVLSGFTLTNGHTCVNPPATNNKERRGGGAYCVGGVLTNCIIAGNSADLDGGGVYAGTLYNCLLIGNAAGDGGGGANNSTLYNCVLVGNSAPSHNGGGAHSSTLWNCTLNGNSAFNNGGGTYSGSLFNCTLSNNRANDGGGAYFSTLYHCSLVGNEGHGGGVQQATLYNCIVYHNLGENQVQSTLNYCCTTPLPTNGVGNITNEPALVNLGTGDLHLRYGSPCIDAGTNLSAIISNDLDGLPRPLDGNGDGIAAFDMGAYEFDLRSVVPTNWFLQYSLDPNDPQVVAGDPDRDGRTTFQEWLADTDPTNAQSCLRITDISNGPPLALYFQSSSNRIYSLVTCTNLAEGLWTSLPSQTDIPGTGNLQFLRDTNPAPPCFYRLSARAP